MAISAGSRLWSMRWEPITADVSSKPRSGFTPGTRRRILIGEGIKVSSEPFPVNAWGTIHEGEEGRCWNEPPRPDRTQVANRLSIAGNDKAFTASPCPQDLSTLRP